MRYYCKKNLLARRGFFPSCSNIILTVLIQRSRILSFVKNVFKRFKLGMQITFQAAKENFRVVEKEIKLRQNRLNEEMNVVQNRTYWHIQVFQSL